MTTGLLVVDKPGGLSSFAAVAAVRRASGVKKAGHAGTLDPMATGVLVVALGQATRLIRYIQEGEKEYLATIQFGVATDSLDADGSVTQRTPMSIERQELEETLAEFLGDILQVPPMVSALKIDGVRLYDLARAGKEVERTPRPVHVSQLHLVDFDPTPGYPLATVRVVVSKGTYVRTLADDIARALGGRAHLVALRRTRVSHFDLGRAITLDDIARWRTHLLAPAQAVSDLPQWRVNTFEAVAVGHGRSLEAISEPGPCAMIGENEELLAVYRPDGVRAVPEVVLG